MRLGKITDALSVEQVWRTGMAIESALLLGLPLNRFITIHWERAGVAEARAAQATGTFLKFARDYFSSMELPFAYVWVRENDEGDGSKGDHVHILAHIPKGQSLGRLQRRWIRKISGKPYRRNVILTRVVARHSQAAHAQPDLYRLNIAIVSHYLLKGASVAAAKASSLPAWRRGGKIIGQRFGMSKNLSRLI